MTREDLKAGHDWVTRKFYRPWRIFRRLVRHIRRPNGIKTALYHAAINVAYYGSVVRWRIKGYDPELKNEGAPDYASADAVGARHAVPNR
jgi:hypothetical protein